MATYHLLRGDVSKRMFESKANEVRHQRAVAVFTQPAASTPAKNQAVPQASLPTNSNPGINNAKAIALRALAGINSEASNDRVAAILGQLTDRSYAVRHAAVNALPNDLTQAEVATLERFLMERKVPGFTAEQTRTLKNDLLNELRGQTVVPKGLDRTLMAIYHDHDQEFGMRDFAIQHLATWYDKVDAAAQPEIRRTLTEALADNGWGIAGTAMIGLYRISLGDHPEVDRSALADAIISAVKEPNTDEITRMTAVQLGAQLHDARLLSAALSLAGGTINNAALRMVAIAAVGDVGTENNIASLESWASGPEEQLRPPAQSALVRIRQRLNR